MSKTCKYFCKDLLQLMTGRLLMIGDAALELDALSVQNHDREDDDDDNDDDEDSDEDDLDHMNVQCSRCENLLGGNLIVESFKKSQGM